MPAVGLRGLSLRNSFGVMPTQISQLTNLTVLNLGGTTLVGGIPAQIGQLTGLTMLDLHDSNLTGPLLSELGNLVKLEELVLSGNRNLPTTLRHFPVQFSDPSFPPLAGSAPSTAVTGSARLIQTSTGSFAALGGPPTKRSGQAA